MVTLDASGPAELPDTQASVPENDLEAKVARAAARIAALGDHWSHVEGVVAWECQWTTKPWRRGRWVGLTPVDSPTSDAGAEAGGTCDLVASFRSDALAMMRKHFKRAFEAKDPSFWAALLAPIRAQADAIRAAIARIPSHRAFVDSFLDAFGRDGPRAGARAYVAERYPRGMLDADPSLAALLRRLSQVETDLALAYEGDDDGTLVDLKQRIEDEVVRELGRLEAPRHRRKVSLLVAPRPSGRTVSFLVARARRGGSDLDDFGKAIRVCLEGIFANEDIKWPMEPDTGLVEAAAILSDAFRGACLKRRRPLDCQECQREE